ncbi:isochorismatase family protein [Nonomuraea jabiensis]|uniref:isochorismatase family protein n=1 Tax=Nonomuraea jabiensis TaxID=882448 RepID=UPI0036A60A65
MNAITDPHLAPRWATSALLTIDVQRDFLSEAPYGVAGTSEVLPALAGLAAAFRAAGRPIVHIVRLYDPDGHDADRVRRRHRDAGQPRQRHRPRTPPAGRAAAEGRPAAVR